MASHGYAPRTDVPCPATPLARLPRYDFPWGLNTQEASYINNRSSKIIPQAWNEWVGDGSGIGYNIASFRDVLPTVGIALGGVGYRGALYDAGVLSALDARNSSAVAAGTGGLLQVSSYISSTSGGAWLTGSLLFNNWPTITDLVYGNGRDTNGWMLDVPITVPDGFNVFSAKNQIFYDRLLKVAGSKNFYSSLTDVWGLMVGYHFLNQSGRETFFSADLEFGAGQLWSDIPSIPVYQQYQVPYPIVVANSPDLLTFEITPHEFGSWDLNISSLTNLEYSGTTPRLKQSDCVTGLDQASFILGTSSNFFNQYLDVRRNMMKGFSQVDASGLLYISSRFDRNTSEGATDAANWPNPFYMTVPATRWSGTSLPTLGLVDGTSNLESIPMGQLLLSSRNLDVIIAADASSDDPIHQWPNGTSVFYTAQRVSKSSSSVYHKGFPPIPANQGEFVSMGLNLRPTFFGCSLDGSKPPSHVLIIYLPNSPPLNGDDPVTNTDIFKASYSLGHAHLFLDQVHSNAISGFTPNSTSSDQYFGKCLQCALIDSARFKTASIVPRSDICSKCFLQYCYDPANPPSKSWVLDRKLTYVDPDGPSPSLSRRDVMIATPSAVGFALAIGLGFLLYRYRNRKISVENAEDAIDLGFISPDKYQYDTFVSQVKDGDPHTLDEAALLSPSKPLPRLPSEAVFDESTTMLLPEHEESDPVYVYDAGRLGRLLTLVGLCGSMVVGALFIGLGIGIHQKAICNQSIIDISAREEGWIVVPLANRTREVISLLLNLVVTLFTETTGYAHGTTLKWALAREGRLNFNANLRLAKAAHGLLSVNGTLVNLLFAASLVVAYVASSLVIIPYVNIPIPLPGSTTSTGSTSVVGSGSLSEYDSQLTLVSFLPLIFLGVSLLLQAFLGLLGFFFTEVRTWSSNPLDVAAALAAGGEALRIPGRCMHSVTDPQDMRRMFQGPTYPLERQESPWQAHEAVRRVIQFTWSLLPAGVLWGLIVWFITVSDKIYMGAISSGSRAFLPGPDSPTLMFRGTAQGILPRSHLLVGLAFIGGLQAALTFALHCCELIVTLSRDEDTWRMAGDRRGSGDHKKGTRSVNPLLSVLRSWKSVGLLICKPVMHWLFGNAMRFVAGNGGGVIMLPFQIFYLTVCMIPVGTFVTFIAVRRPSGPQPAAYGHLQTLLNLVDDWSSPVMYWGHKSGSEGEVCHAGTSSKPLPPVHKDTLYAGPQTLGSHREIIQSC